MLALLWGKVVQKVFGNTAAYLKIIQYFGWKHNIEIAVSKEVFFAEKMQQVYVEEFHK